MLRRWCIPLAGLALVIGSLAATAPAAAARQAAHEPAAGQLARPTIHLIRPAARGPRPLIAWGNPKVNARSTNWSGYAAHHGKYQSVSASWVEPKGHCHSGRTYSSFWVGLDGYGSRTVEQTGSEVDCAGGRPRYFAWFEMFPAFPKNFSNRVRPGDHFTASVRHTGGHHYTLVIKDRTQHWSHTEHKSLSSAKNASAEVIAEAPCCTSSGNPLPLANFGTVHFSGASVNGRAISRSRPTKIIMVNNGGRAKVSVSGLSSGKNFKVTWRHST
jgi:peptidase A4-like protein